LLTGRISKMAMSRNLAAKLSIALFLFFVTISIAHFSYAGEDYVTDELIVKMKSGADQSAVAAEVSRRGSVLRKSFSDLRMMLVQVAPGYTIEEAQTALESNPDVEYVEKNYIVYADLNPNDPKFGQQTYLNVIDAPLAWNTQTGNTNAVIAVLDTGVEGTHEDITGKLLPGCSVIGGFTESSCGSNVDDNNGHGTGVAGTAAAKTNNGIGVAGLCWNCPILPVKVLGDGGSGTLADTVEGILFARNYALNNPTKKVVINMSLGRDCQASGVTQSEQDAINAAWNAGVLIVASAGNSGNSNLQCPAAANHVIAVSATTNSDTLASFSSYGSFVDLAAPGVGIVNAIGTSNTPGSFYASWSGTSFSSPIVSGVAGLVWSAKGTLTNAEVDQILRDTAENIGSATFFGDGRVNADFAVDLASSGSPAPSPAPTPPPGPVPTPTPAPITGGTLSGFVPGTAGVKNSLTVTGAPAGSSVRFYYSRYTGTTSITSGVCKGKTLGLRSPSLIGTATADSTGKATINANLSSTLGGRTIYIQSRVENSTSCKITNRVTQTIKRKSGSSSTRPIFFR
jgi:subtilisin family serine protease